MAKRRILLIGWDGATYRWITPLMAAGRLPTLQRLMKRSASGDLAATVPPHTAPGWTTVMTGKGPAQHGVFLFDELLPRSYACRGRVLDSRAIAGQTLFDVVSAAGGKVAALWVPMTHPVWAINGVMVSGYPAPQRGQGRAYPAERADLTERMPIDPIGNDPVEKIDVYERKIDTLTNIALEHITDPTYDLVMVVYQQTDHVHHLFWQYCDPGHPLYTPDKGLRYGNLIARCYERLDDGLARLLQAVDDDTLVMLVSDHGGMSAPARHVHLNSWLAANGYLMAQSGASAARASLAHRALHLGIAHTPVLFRRALKTGVKRLPRGVFERVERARFNAGAIDWGRTRAYRFPLLPSHDGIMLNMRGRQVQGIVETDAYDTLRADLVARLRALQDPETKQPVVAAVHYREEVYPRGPFADQAPDLLVEYTPAYQSGARTTGHPFGPVPVEELDHYSGIHDSTGIVFVAGAGVRPEYRVEGMELADVPPTVLWAAGWPVPEAMEGTVRQDLFAQDAQESPVSYIAFAGQRHNADFTYTAEEEESVNERLRALGYIE